jgi:hypothetical protein
MKRLFAALLLGVLATAAPAQASYHYSTTIRFSGKYESTEYDSGTVINHVVSSGHWSVHDPTTVVTVQRGAYALFPSGHTRARISFSQSGGETCAVWQPFTDLFAAQPIRAWFTLKRGRTTGTIGFGWAGETVHRQYAAVTGGDCVADRTTALRAEAGCAAMASGFGIKIKLSNKKLLKGRSIVRRIKISKQRSDLLDGTGLVETFTGTYTVSLSRG